MQRLTENDPATKSPDLAAANLAALRALFPELVTEGKDGVAVNLDVLKQLVGDKTVTDAEEKYGLNWHGKRRARQLALGLVAWHHALKPAGETTVVFRDSAFADDVAKTNLTAILHQHGLETVRSL